MAALGLCCFARAFSRCSEQELFLMAVKRLFTAMASLVAEHRLQHTGSVVVALGLSCFEACGILLAQGSNP